MLPWQRSPHGSMRRASPCPARTSSPPWCRRSEPGSGPASVHPGVRPNARAENPWRLTPGAVERRNVPGDPLVYFPHGPVLV